MAVQDDRREKEMRQLFKLYESGEGREGVDALFVDEAFTLPFELKSTTKNSFSTVRDLGPDHIKKWRKTHWLFGVYDGAGEKLQYCIYGSPEMMEGWIGEMERYVQPDFVIARHAPKVASLDLIFEILGKKDKYTYEDARRLHKNQYSKKEYLARMDALNGYSPKMMLEILRERCQYLVERGATLNNPHIPLSYFDGWEKITKNHATRLGELVLNAVRAQKKAG